MEIPKEHRIRERIVSDAIGEFLYDHLWTIYPRDLISAIRRSSTHHGDMYTEEQALALAEAALYATDDSNDGEADHIEIDVSVMLPLTETDKK